MPFTKPSFHPRFATAVAVIVVMSPPTMGQVENPHTDPAKVLGAESCAKCHDAEVEVWKDTPHYKTFRSLHRKPEAKQIAERMGLRSIKRGETCVKCHYTEQVQGERTRAVSGISCESCHGAARDWIQLHSDYGGPQVTKLEESAQHKQLRRERSIAHGMRNPVNVYSIARSCLKCHTTPNERLVNVGVHPPGSLDFELVSWSQGLVRHNFVSSHGKRNAYSSPDRVRVMFIAGVMADLEFSLRATALATAKAPFGVTSALRANTMKKQLQLIQSLVRNSYVDQAVAAAESVQLKLNNSESLLRAADSVAEAGFQFAATASGAELSGVDTIMPAKSDYR